MYCYFSVHCNDVSENNKNCNKHNMNAEEIHRMILHDTVTEDEAQTRHRTRFQARSSPYNTIR